MKHETTRVREQGTVVTVPQTPEERMAALHRIVSEKQYAKIDGYMVDLFTASLIVQVYDALNAANQVRYAGFPVMKMAHIAFKLTDKAS